MKKKRSGVHDLTKSPEMRQKLIEQQAEAWRKIQSYISVLEHHFHSSVPNASDLIKINLAVLFGEQKRLQKQIDKILE